jgi:hypothetical protein
MLFCCSVVLSDRSSRSSESNKSNESSKLKVFSVKTEDSAFCLDLNAVVVARVLSDC